jgi:hypothetical protein
MTACLVAESGLATTLQKRVVRVGGDAKADLSFAGVSGLAPLHFEVVGSDVGHAIRALQAQLPLLVNGQPVTHAELADGDVISAGDLTLIYGSGLPEASDPAGSGLGVASSVSGDDFVSRLVDAPSGMPSQSLGELSGGPGILAAFLAGLAALFITVIAYSFVCNLRWPFFVVGTLVLGHAVGRVFRWAGDGVDLRLGQFAALAAFAGVLVVNGLTLAGVMNIYEVVSPPPTVPMDAGHDPVEMPEEGQGTLGTGQAAQEVTFESLVKAWQKANPWKLLSGDHTRLVPITGISAVMVGPKSLLAYLLVMISAYRGAFQSRPSTPVSVVAAGH